MTVSLPLLCSPSPRVSFMISKSQEPVFKPTCQRKAPSFPSYYCFLHVIWCVCVCTESMVETHVTFSKATSSWGASCFQSSSGEGSRVCGLPAHCTCDPSVIKDRLEPKTGMNMTRVNLVF